MAARIAKLVLGCIWDPHSEVVEGGGHRGSAMIPFERAIVVSYWLSIVIIALSVNIRNLRSNVLRSNQQGRKGSADISQVLTRSGRVIALSYVKEIVSISFAV